MKKLCALTIFVFTAFLLYADDTNSAGREKYHQAIMTYESAEKVYLAMGEKDGSKDYLYGSYEEKAPVKIKKEKDEPAGEPESFRTLRFYPFTFDIFGGILSSCYDNGSVLSGYFSFNAGAYVLYHFNDIVAFKTGVLLAPSGYESFNVSYLNIPVALVFKSYGLSTLSMGMYFGPKLWGTYGGYSGYSDSDMYGTDIGIHAGYIGYGVNGDFGTLFGITVHYSLLPFHPELETHNGTIMLNWGIIL
jgi:hypothetical protein